MTATNLGLGGQPASFLGAYIININSSLGLSQSPSTCTVTLLEDENVVPQALFQPPEVGDFKIIEVGKFSFGGIVTSYKVDIANIGGRSITVNLSDAREIMKSIPLIIAPGYREVAAGLKNTSNECSLIDVFGAYYSTQFGLNFSTWNQSGMTYEDIARVFSGGSVLRFDVLFKIPTAIGRVFGQNYYFDLSEVTAKVDNRYRFNSNLVNIADFIQDVASRHSFDWFLESKINKSANRVDVKVKVIDRSIDNIDLDLDTFLADNAGFVISADKGFELRNEISCAVLLGSPVEQLVTVTVRGLANNPIDLRDEGGSETYLMTEEEMRYVLAGKEMWKQWVALNGGPARYEMSAVTTIIAPLWSVLNSSDLANQMGINPDRFHIKLEDEELSGRMYDKLQGHAQATYGKRFIFNQLLDVEYIDAAWTSDVISGNNDPNEYFRNGDGKTRCYVEFAPSSLVNFPFPVPPPTNFQTFGLGPKAPRALELELKNSFDIGFTTINVDKSDYMVGENQQIGPGPEVRFLYVAATVEEGNVVKLDSPVIYSSASPDELLQNIARAGPNQNRITVVGQVSTSAERYMLRRGEDKGETDGQLHQKAYQPTRVFLPARSRFNRYGPVFASNLGKESAGALVIDQDDGFSPWEFGGTSLMIQAMQFRVDNAASQVKTIETANIVVEGFPKLSIGDSLGKNSNINSINITFGGQVTTTYELRSFLRQFGELSKEELALFSLFARRSGARYSPQDTVAFINKYRPIISKQFGGKGSSSSGALKGGAGNFE